MELLKRKSNRLRNYDYAQNGAYFITICTNQHRCILGKVAGRGGQWPPEGQPAQVVLSGYGEIVKRAIENVPHYYPYATIDHYVIMPNHVHFIIVLQNALDGRPMTAPTISDIVNQMKGYVTKQIGRRIWQKSFHDHVIRSEAGYQKIWQYIDANPMMWAEDCYYEPTQ